MNNVFIQGKYGSIHVWETLLSVVEAQQCNIRLNNDDGEGWFFINGETFDEDTFYAYPGSHRLVIIKFYKYNQVEISQLPLNFPIYSDKGIEVPTSEPAKKLLSLHHISKLEDYIECVVSKDGKYVSIITKNGNFELDKYEYQVSLYNIKSNNEISPKWSAKYNEPHSMIFSPDSKYLVFVCVSTDGYWDEIISIGLHNANNLCWEANSQCLFFVCDDNQTPEEYNALHFQSLSDRLPWWREQKVIGHISFNGDCREEEIVKRITKKCLMFIIFS